MSKKRDDRQETPKPSKDKPFFRPFEAVARQLAADKAREAEAAKAEKAAAPAAGKPGSKAAAPAGRPATGGKPTSPGLRPARSEAPVVDDGVTFADLLYGVKPMSTAPKPRAVVQSSEAVTVAAEDESVRAHLRALVSGGDARFEISDDGRRIEGRRIDLDVKVVRRLRRGEFQVDIECDLHGLKAFEARARLEEAVAKAQIRGERVLLAVHGKGQHSAGGAVLRGEMAAWLSQGAASAHVAAFTTATDDDGGEGALYVLLRR
jgi:DNA-nicking Smr family endonuclease